MKVPKIALIRLEKHPDGYDFANEHVGLGYLASALRKKEVEVKIFDDQLFSEAEILDEIRDFNPLVVGYTVTSRNLLRVLEFDTKLDLAGTFRCVGGHHVSLCYSDFLANSNIDAVILGEGEETFPELVWALFDNTSLRDVRGIAYKQNDVVYRTNARGLSPLDDFEWPARDMFFKSGEQAARILSSRGCFQDCTFCTTPAMRSMNPGPAYRERNPIDVVDEMEFLVQHGIEYFYFNDDLYFSGKKGRGKASVIAEELIRRKLKVQYKVELRADSADPLKDWDFMARLKESGLERIFVGIESGSNEMLQFLGKKTNADLNIRFVNFLKDVGFKVNIGKILFGPFTSWEELQRSIAFFGEIGCCDQLMRRPNMQLEAFPGTPLTKRLQDSDLLLPTPPCERQIYKFEDPLVGEFCTELAQAFSLYFPLLKGYFQKKAYGVTGPEDREWIQNLCLQFLMSNVNLGSVWNKNKFKEYLDEFIGAIKEH